MQQRIVALNILFKYENDPLPVKTPKGELEKHEIYLQDTHMAFLWCCCYITVSLNNLYYEKALADKQDVVTFNDQEQFKKAMRTLNWAKSLKNEFCEWPTDIARPDISDEWTAPATNLYQACVVYLLLHEIGHIVLHQEMVALTKKRSNPFYTLTIEDRTRIYNAEIEADQFALDSLIGHSTIDDVRLIKYIGAIVAHLSNFYMLDTPDTRGGTHPDYDDRLRSVVNQVNLKTEAGNIHFHAHLNVGLQLFFNLTGKQYISDQAGENTFRDFGELEAHLFGMINTMKNASR